MLLEQTKHNIKTHLPGSVKECTIANNAMTFKILATNLYSDIPAAITRELSCNAWDAHVDAGTEDIPFEWFLPSTLNPTLRLRDYGTGMSPETVQGTYATYMDSTKRDTNDQIGAFGIGSKSPFAYYESKGLDSFTIVSYWHGKKYTYMAFINEAGTPTIAGVGEEATDERNGIEIMIPIRNEDFGAFGKAMQDVLKYFPGRYKVHGIDIPKLVTDRESNNGILFTGENSYRTRSKTFPAMHALVGPVRYRLDMDILGKRLDQLKDKYPKAMRLKHALHNNSNYCLLKLDIGSVTITPSREALTMDDRSVLAILAKTDEFAADLMKEDDDKLATLTDLSARLDLMQTSPFFGDSEMRGEIEKHYTFDTDDGSDYYRAIHYDTVAISHSKNRRGKAMDAFMRVTRGNEYNTLLNLFRSGYKEKDALRIFLMPQDSKAHGKARLHYELDKMADTNQATFHVYHPIVNADDNDLIALFKKFFPEAVFVDVAKLEKRPATTTKTSNGTAKATATTLRTKYMRIRENSRGWNFRSLGGIISSPTTVTTSEADNVFVINAHGYKLMDDEREREINLPQLSTCLTTLTKQGLTRERKVLLLNKSLPKYAHNAFAHRSLLKYLDRVAKEIFQQLVEEEKLGPWYRAQYIDRNTIRPQDQFIYGLITDAGNSPTGKALKQTKQGKIIASYSDANIVNGDWRFKFLEQYESLMCEHLGYQHIAEIKLPAEFTNAFVELSNIVATDCELLLQMAQERLKDTGLAVLIAKHFKGDKA